MAIKDDEIVAEVRRHREAHAAALGYDVARIAEDLRRQDREAGTQPVTRPPRAPVVERKRKSA